MPKKEHEALQKEAKKKGLKGEEAERYVYGTLYKRGKGKGDTKRPNDEPKGED